MKKKMLENWIGLLTSKGYDIVGTSGMTSRHEKGEEYWNSNMPMPSLSFHFRAIAEQKAKVPEIVVNCYATNSKRFTIYATGFSGKAFQRYMGFTVQGKNETSISNLEELESLLSFVKTRDF